MQRRQRQRRQQSPTGQPATDDDDVMQFSQTIPHTDADIVTMNTAEVDSGSTVMKKQQGGEWDAERTRGKAAESGVPQTHLQRFSREFLSLDDLYEQIEIVRDRLDRGGIMNQHVLTTRLATLEHQVQITDAEMKNLKVAIMRHLRNLSERLSDLESLQPGTEPKVYSYAHNPLLTSGDYDIPSANSKQVGGYSPVRVNENSEQEAYKQLRENKKYLELAKQEFDQLREVLVEFPFSQKQISGLETTVSNRIMETLDSWAELLQANLDTKMSEMEKAIFQRISHVETSIMSRLHALEEEHQPVEGTWDNNGHMGPRETEIVEDLRKRMRRLEHNQKEQQKQVFFRLSQLERSTEQRIRSLYSFFTQSKIGGSDIENVIINSGERSNPSHSVQDLIGQSLKASGKTAPAYSSSVEGSQQKRKLVPPPPPPRNSSANTHSAAITNTTQQPVSSTLEPTSRTSNRSRNKTGTFYNENVQKYTDEHNSQRSSRPIESVHSRAMSDAQAVVHSSKTSDFGVNGSFKDSPEPGYRSTGASSHRPSQNEFPQQIVSSPLLTGDSDSVDSMYGSGRPSDQVFRLSSFDDSMDRSHSPQTEYNTTSDSRKPLSISTSISKQQESSQDYSIVNRPINHNVETTPVSRSEYGMETKTSSGENEAVNHSRSESQRTQDGKDPDLSLYGSSTSKELNDDHSTEMSNVAGKANNAENQEDLELEKVAELNDLTLAEHNACGEHSSRSSAANKNLTDSTTKGGVNNSKKTDHEKLKELKRRLEGETEEQKLAQMTEEEKEDYLANKRQQELHNKKQSSALKSGLKQYASGYSVLNKKSKRGGRGARGGKK